MIKKIINGYEHYECSNCGEETDMDEDYCQVCGHEFSDIRNDEVLEDNASEDETICIVIGASKSGIFTFTQLKIDKPPKMLLNLLSFQSQRLMAEANPYEFYVFDAVRYPHLSPGVQVNLNLDNYDYFQTPNGFKIFYDRTHLSSDAIAELKTYNFNL